MIGFLWILGGQGNHYLALYIVLDLQLHSKTRQFAAGEELKFLSGPNLPDIMHAKWLDHPIESTGGDRSEQYVANVRYVSSGRGEVVSIRTVDSCFAM